MRHRGARGRKKTDRGTKNGHGAQESWSCAAARLAVHGQKWNNGASRPSQGKRWTTTVHIIRQCTLAGEWNNGFDGSAAHSWQRGHHMPSVWKNWPLGLAKRMRARLSRCMQGWAGAGGAHARAQVPPQQPQQWRRCAAMPRGRSAPAAGQLGFA